MKKIYACARNQDTVVDKICERVVNGVYCATENLNDCKHCEYKLDRYRYEITVKRVTKTAGKTKKERGEG